MPNRFEYSSPIDERPRFECTLIRVRCHHIRSNGDRCRRVQSTGVGLCSHHLQTDQFLKISTSTVHNAGRGLFACDNTRMEGAIVFAYDRMQNYGDFITEYTGQILSEVATDSRYGRNHTVPYGVRLNSRSNIDAACLRGVGSFANHNGGKHTNARLISDGKRVYMEATKPIRNGSEIFIDYGKEYHIQQEGINYSHRTREV